MLNPLFDCPTFTCIVLVPVCFNDTREITCEYIETLLGIRCRTKSGVKIKFQGPEPLQPSFL